MKDIALFLLLLIVVGNACSSSSRHLFGKKTPHEKYAEKLDDKDLDDTPEGRAWLAASKKALEEPQRISLPYRQHGYFHSDKPRALGLYFNARQGERITFNITKRSSVPIALYADIFKEHGTDPLFSADTASTEFSFDADEAGSYILRLQPELFRSGEYSLSVSVGPSLDFPVSGGKAKVGSVWGDSRDGGKRRHEGIDIFAPKLTPAIAAADGYISGVREGGIGGKTVWLRPNDKNFFLYYAHLDKQLVQEGQFVKKGDVVGLVGNTGNAQYTPSHLHFGVYSFAGPIDPLPFVNRTVKTAPALPFKNLNTTLKLTKAQKSKNGTLIQANTVLIPLAISVKGYIAELPDGSLIQAPTTAVKAVQPSTKPQTEAIATKRAGKSKKS